VLSVLETFGTLSLSNNRKGDLEMVQIWLVSWMQKILSLALRFAREEQGDEILEKAAVIAAITVAVLVIIVLGSLAANALNSATGWFG
jgi:uncharacterized membrane protein